MTNIEKLSEYLTRVLDEDQWKTAEDLLSKVDYQILYLRAQAAEDREVMAGMTKQHSEVSEYLQTELESARTINKNLKLELQDKITKMELTQRDKEEIYNKYMEFVDNISDDLDTFSEVSPKELVYAVLGLVDELLSGDCKACHKGTMKEMSIYDDMDGMLTCDKCGVRVKN